MMQNLKSGTEQNLFGEEQPSPPTNMTRVSFFGGDRNRIVIEGVGYCLSDSLVNHESPYKAWDFAWDYAKVYFDPAKTDLWMDGHKQDFDQARITFLKECGVVFDTEQGLMLHCLLDEIGVIQ